MARLRDVRPKNVSGSYERLFDNAEIGALSSKVQAAVIRSGTELEKMIARLVPNIPDLDTFLEQCPSSKQMGLLSVFHREDLAHLCLMLSRLALMVQAAVLGGQFFDLFSLFDDGGVASKVGVGWSYVADALVVALVVVVIDEGADLVFEIAG